MDKKAQAGLEYLMTYGWALIMVAAIIGALVLLAATPTEQPAFSSTSPGKLMVKGSSFSQGSATIKLQNITGGLIKITSFTGFGENCRINGIQSGVEFSIGPGGELLITCDATANYSVPLSIEYTDQTGLTQNTIITPSKIPENKCGNGILDTADGEECDGTQGVPAIAGLSCRSGCRGINISGCLPSSLTEEKTYYIKDSFDASGTTCINIAKGTLDCDSKTIELGLTALITGISITGPATVKNCTIKGGGSRQLGIKREGIVTFAVSIENNTVSLSDAGSSGIYFRADLTETSIVGNNTSESSCGMIVSGTPKQAQGNNCRKCSGLAASCNLVCGTGNWTPC